MFHKMEYKTTRKRQATQRSIVAVVLFAVWFTLEVAILILAFLQEGFPLSVVLWMEALILVPALFGLILISSAMEQHSDTATPYSYVCGFISLAAVAVPCTLYVVVSYKAFDYSQC